MTAAAIAAFAAQTQTVLEDCSAGTLTLAGSPYACARGPWRNSARLDEQTQSLIEGRQVGVRVRKSLLTAGGATVTPMTTDCALDGVACLVVAVAAGPNDEVFHLTLEAAAPAAVQP